MYLSSGIELNNRYVIESLLGHGGFGITYAAYDKVLNVKVAIKEYLPRQLSTRGEGQTKVSVFTGESGKHYQYGLRKFLEEARVLAHFSDHPNIVSVRDFFEANGTAYIVMSFLEGITLKDYLSQKGGRLPFEAALDIMAPVMDALREVHSVHLLHRDISPDNIFLTTSQQVKLIDFGAARYQAGEHSKTLSIILKAGYAPEEQYRSSGKQGPWTDVYAVAATFYRLITGQTPPDALDRLDHDTLDLPSHLRITLPVNTEGVLLKALAVKANDRFQTIAQFHGALLGMASGIEYTQVFPAEPTPKAATKLNKKQEIHQIPKTPGRVLRVRSSSPLKWLGWISILAVLIVGLAYVSLHQQSFKTKENLPKTVATLPGTSKEERKPLADPVYPPKQEASDLFEQGNKFLVAKDYEKAVDAYQQAIRLNPDEPRAHRNLGLAYGQLGRYQEAVAAFQKATRLYQNDYLTHFSLGLAYGKLGRYQEAVAAFQKAIRLNPNDATAYDNLGLVYEKLSKHQEAVQAYLQAIRLKPDDAQEYSRLGLAYEKLDRNQQAVAALQQAIRLNPGDYLAHFNIGLVYGKLGRNEDAVAAFQQAIRLKPDNALGNALTYFGLGQAYGELGRYPEAIQAFRQAIRFKPDYADAYYNLGLTYNKLGRYQEEVQAFQQVIQLKPEESEAHYILGIAYIRLGHYQEAGHAFRQVIRLKPEDAIAYNNLGYVYLQLGRHQEAVQAFQQAIRFKQDLASAHYSLGEIYITMENYEGAQSEYKILINLDKNLARRLYSKLGDRKLQPSP